MKSVPESASDKFPRQGRPIARCGFLHRSVQSSQQPCHKSAACELLMEKRRESHLSSRTRRETEP